MEKGAIIIIGGGSRGLAKSLLDTYELKGYTRIAFHRSREVLNTRNFNFNIDEEISISKSQDQLISISNSDEFQKFSIHFVSGGGLGVEFSDSDINAYKRVLNHNLIVPTVFTSKIFNNYYSFNNKKIELFYYSSAVVKNLGGSPYYSSAKSSLETMFKSSFLIRPKGIYMYLLRLGFVDIKHKFYHKLAISDPKEFQRLVIDNLPSKHFTKPEEISELCLIFSEKSNIMNGTISDISGGHSWI